MNVIFLDFDGTLHAMHDNYDENGNSVSELNIENVEKRIALLAEVCQEFNCKVVIEAAAKSAIDEETMEIDPEATWVRQIFDLFKKYGIECIGRTPEVKRITGPNSYISMWKEDEIRLYLYRHPEREHYCVLDDNDTVNLMHWKKSDLEKVSDHLVETTYICPEHPELEGLLPCHKELIGKTLEKENEVRRLVLKRKGIKT